jgi:membrane protease YdiL (CAAX protease family)
MMAQILHRDSSARPAIEALALMALVLLGSLVVPAAKGTLVLLPVVYLLVERPLRHRSWASIGLSGRTFLPALRATWPLVLLVGVGTQALVALPARLFWPELLAHIQGRIPLLSVTGAVAFLIPLLLSTFIEELTFRGLFQARASWLIGTVPAILLVSVVFGLMHIAPGNPAVVVVDVAAVMVDALVYGTIFARGRNLYVCWLAHYLADVVGLLLIVAL